MVSSSADANASPDLNDCDREPIHIPGSIQPHGLLLVADIGSLTVEGGAGDLEAAFGTDWQGRSLSDLLGQDIGALLHSTPVGPGGTLLAAPVSIAGASHDVALHRGPSHLLVELEPGDDRPMAAGPTLAWLDAIAAGFERTGDLIQLCERAAAAFRALTGFDRVMIYRFLDDDAGRVIAEDRDPALGTFLHHHFPATDIPRQARALYVRNRARTIPTVGYAPAPLRPASLQTIDLSDVALRSVSPIHLHYLRNMGVEASASISIVKDGVLWGLVACHHNSPRFMPRDVRAAASTLASGLARQIRAKEEAETYRERLRLRAVEDNVMPRVGEEPLRRGVRIIAEELTAMLGADGFAFVDGATVDCYGHCPAVDEVRDLATWARQRSAGDAIATHHLAAQYPSARDFSATASGLLALPLVDDGIVLLWFRAEQLQEIEWAGNPHSKGDADPQAVLTPRHSFDSWSETVRHRSRRWSLEEVEAAHRLRRAFHDAHVHRQIRRLNAELQASVADKDALIAQKDMLMGEVDHRIQNSLQLVSAFLSMQARAAGEGEVRDHLTEAQARLSAVALVHRRLYRDDQIETIDLSRYLDELVGDLRTSLGTEWASAMRLDAAPVLIPTDRAVSVGLLMTELVINATKYAYDGAAGPLDILLEQHGNRLRLIVADHGRGKSDTVGGTGFGSRMLTAMVAKLGGGIEYLDNHPGLRAIVTAPIQSG